jgi:multidrug resistance efflux pump
MTWTQRLRLAVGMLAVLALTAALVLVFNQRQSQALSVTAQVVTDQAAVGAAYGGVVTQQLAKEGDEVTKGEKLFVVTSSELQRDASQGLKVTSTDAFDVNLPASTVTYKALSSGKLESVTAQGGSFVQNGANIATISAVGSQYAVADFVLSPRDYERIVKGADVSLRLPDDSSVQGTVQAVSVKTEGAQALTRVTIASDALHEPRLSELTHPGTPVAATLTLRDDGVLAGPTDVLRSLLIKVGLK